MSLAQASSPFIPFELFLAEGRARVITDLDHLAARRSPMLTASQVLAVRNLSNRRQNSVGGQYADVCQADGSEVVIPTVVPLKSVPRILNCTTVPMILESSQREDRATSAYTIRDEIEPHAGDI